MNKVILCGNLTKDVELRSASNTAIGIFTLAVMRNYKNTNGDYESDFINCKVFGDKANTLAKYVGKGSKLLIDGRLQTGSYEKEDGTKVYTTDVIVDNFEFVGSKKENTTEPKKEVKEEINDPFKEFAEQIEVKDDFLD